MRSRSMRRTRTRVLNTRPSAVRGRVRAARTQPRKQAPNSYRHVTTRKHSGYNQQSSIRNFWYRTSWNKQKKRAALDGYVHAARLRFRSMFQRYRARKRDFQQRYRARKSKFRRIAHAFFTEEKFARSLRETYPDTLLRMRLGNRWEALMARHMKMQPHRQFGHSAIKIIGDGSAVFRQLWDSIGAAKKRVWMETYILADDAVAQKTVDALTAASKRGVHVILLYDAIGCFPRPPVKQLEELKAAGGHVVEFRSLFTGKYRFDALSDVMNRNHRKTTIIDGDTAFCGGMNIGSDYAGPEVGGNGRFKDMHAKLKGPVVFDLAAILLSSLKIAMPNEWKDTIQPWTMAKHKKERIACYKASRRNPEFDTYIQAIESDPAVRAKRKIQRALLDAIRSAMRHIYIITPYLLAPIKIRQALCNAAKRGVDVQILKAGKCDIHGMQGASRYGSLKLMPSGVKVYEYMTRELHMKMMTIDGIYSVVGSYNFDILSYKHNLEVNLHIFNPKIAGDLCLKFMNYIADLHISRQLTTADMASGSVIGLVKNFVFYQIAVLFCTFCWAILPFNSRRFRAKRRRLLM